jgi:hypothetical protein
MGMEDGGETTSPPAPSHDGVPVGRLDARANVLVQGGPDNLQIEGALAEKLLLLVTVELGHGCVGHPHRFERALARPVVQLE